MTKDEFIALYLIHHFPSDGGAKAIINLAVLLANTLQDEGRAPWMSNTVNISNKIKGITRRLG
jgi:hypothetical protein